MLLLAASALRGIEGTDSIEGAHAAVVTTLGPAIGVIFAIGLLASWLGTLCWNEASQRLPPALAGQLIVFETLAALSYAFVLRKSWPQVETLVGVALLIAGVVWAVRTQPAEAGVDAHPN